MRASGGLPGVHGGQRRGIVVVGVAARAASNHGRAVRPSRCLPRRKDRWNNPFCPRILPWSKKLAEAQACSDGGLFSATSNRFPACSSSGWSCSPGRSTYRSGGLHGRGTRTIPPKTGCPPASSNAGRRQSALRAVCRTDRPVHSPRWRVPVPRRDERASGPHSLGLSTLNTSKYNRPPGRNALNALVRLFFRSPRDGMWPNA